MMIHQKLTMGQILYCYLPLSPTLWFMFVLRFNNKFTTKGC